MAPPAPLRPPRALQERPKRRPRGPKRLTRSSKMGPDGSLRASGSPRHLSRWLTIARPASRWLRR
eukprot:6642435-Pyramimonas_sp.AAC.1